MTITVADLIAVPDNGTADQSNASGSFTPPANSRVVVIGFAQTDAPTATAYYDPQLTTTITGWTTSMSRTNRSADTGLGFNPQIAIYEGVMGASPTSGTMTIDWDTTTGTAFGAFQGFYLTGTVAIPTHKQTMATPKIDNDAGGNSETHTTNALGAAATTGNTCIVSFCSAIDGAGAATTPSGWSPVGTPGSANYSTVGIWSRTDFTGTTETCTDLGQVVESSASVLMEFEEVGGGAPPAIRILRQVVI